MPTKRETRVRPWLRWTVLAILVITGLLQFWLTPFSTDEGQFAYQLSHGQVASFTILNPHPQSGWGLQPLRGLHTYDSDFAVQWSDRFGMTREAGLSGVAGQNADGSNVDTGQLADALVAAAPRPKPQVVPEGQRVTDHATWAFAVVMLAMLGFLVFGNYQPRRMTKWATFWTYVLPFNVGMIWAVSRDAPWDPPMARLPRPEPGDTTYTVPTSLLRPRSSTPLGVRRRGGWAMFLLTSFILYGLVGAVLHDGVGNLLSGPSSKPGWHLVRGGTP